MWLKSLNLLDALVTNVRIVTTYSHLERILMLQSCQLLGGMRLGNLAVTVVLTRLRFAPRRSWNLIKVGRPPVDLRKLLLQAMDDGSRSLLFDRRCRSNHNYFRLLRVRH